jgi:Asp-tRNA(Asn)/Glu-tRNA(Gln) amidotransferase A subunit family amidase
MPTGYNSAIYKDVLATVDAGPIIALRAAGALIFGKTATTEFAVSRVGPPTRNPHDSTRTPGGSSSGSAASTADYQVPLALGTQTVGSVVRPASFNGVYGFKVSFTKSFKIRPQNQTYRCGYT